MMKRKNDWAILLVFVLSALLLSACQTSTNPSDAERAKTVGKVVKVEGGTYHDISVAELQTQMQKKDFTLVNVHVPFEGNLPNTDLSIPYDTIGQNLDKLPEEKSSKIVLYCRSGSMSTTASKELVKLGYTNIWNLSGGMIAWEQAGQPIEK